MVRKKNSSDPLDSWLPSATPSIQSHIDADEARAASTGRSAITPARPPINLGETMMTAMRHRTVDTNGIRRY